jgi:hypothetical protein
MRGVEEITHTMSFGKNPHVAKAQDAEMKARAADDDHARASAWREAARLWERAAEKERFDKKAAEYRTHADNARREADGEAAPEEESAPAVKAAAAPAKVDRSSLN